MVQAKYEIMEAAERSPVCYCFATTTRRHRSSIYGIVWLHPVLYYDT